MPEQNSSNGVPDALPVDLVERLVRPGSQDTQVSLPQTDLPRPLGNRLLVRQVPVQKMAGRFYVPDGAETFENRGTVLRVGPKVEEDPDAPKPGDVVLFARRPSTALDTDRRLGESGGAPQYRDLLMLKLEDILAVVEP